VQCDARDALVLYGEASSAARDAPVLATGLSPLNGVLVPTFGALYSLGGGWIGYLIAGFIGACILIAAARAFGGAFQRT